MSNLGAQIEQGLTGRTVPPAATAGLAARLLLVQEREGSNVKSAKAAGVSEATWRRWRITAGLGTSRYTHRGRSPGTNPSARHAARLAELAEAAVRDRAIVNRPTDYSIVVKAQHPEGADEGRPRTIPARALELRPGTADAVVRAYIEGGPDDAAREFLRGIRNDYFGPALAYDGPDPEEGYGLVVTQWIA